MTIIEPVINLGSQDFVWLLRQWTGQHEVEVSLVQFQGQIIKFLTVAQLKIYALIIELVSNFDWLHREVIKRAFETLLSLANLESCVVFSQCFDVLGKYFQTRAHVVHDLELVLHFEVKLFVGCVDADVCRLRLHIFLLILFITRLLLILTLLTLANI